MISQLKDPFHQYIGNNKQNLQIQQIKNKYLIIQILNTNINKINKVIIKYKIKIKF